MAALPHAPLPFTTGAPDAAGPSVCSGGTGAADPARRMFITLPGSTAIDMSKEHCGSQNPMAAGTASQLTPPSMDLLIVPLTLTGLPPLGVQETLSSNVAKKVVAGVVPERFTAIFPTASFVSVRVQVAFPAQGSPAVETHIPPSTGGGAVEPYTFTTMVLTFPGSMAISVTSRSGSAF